MQKYGVNYKCIYIFNTWCFFFFFFNKTFILKCVSKNWYGFSSISFKKSAKKKRVK